MSTLAKVINLSLISGFMAVSLTACEPAPADKDPYEDVESEQLIVYTCTPDNKTIEVTYQSGGVDGAVLVMDNVEYPLTPVDNEINNQILASKKGLADGYGFIWNQHENEAEMIEVPADKIELYTENNSATSIAEQQTLFTCVDQ